MSLGDRLREMLDPGTTAQLPGPTGPGRRRQRGVQAQPVNPSRGYDPEPGKPMARAQWIALEKRDALPLDQLASLLRESYDLVVAKLTRKVRDELMRASEARLIALACGAPPEGQARWTLRLLAEQLVELQVLGTVSRECVRQVLKKTN